MPSEIDSSAWSGEGGFTQVLIDCLRELPTVRFLRVEDAPATRSDADYNFISNEIFVGFATVERRERFRRLGVLPASRPVTEPAMTIEAPEAALTFGGRSGRAGLQRRDHAAVHCDPERIVPPYPRREVISWWS